MESQAEAVGRQDGSKQRSAPAAQSRNRRMVPGQPASPQAGAHDNHSQRADARLDPYRQPGSGRQNRDAALGSGRPSSRRQEQAGRIRA